MGHHDVTVVTQEKVCRSGFKFPNPETMNFSVVDAKYFGELWSDVMKMLNSLNLGLISKMRNSWLQEQS